jgi:Na+/proline symporter
MLAFSILAYLLANLGVGLWASKKISTTRDFVLAGRQLPLILAASATFATWFGSETIMGAPTEFIEHGVLGIIEDPFGASLCLFLVGLFFARRFYKMNIITFCDFFRLRYGRNAELLSAALIIPSYFSWIAAQLLAMGIVLKIVLGWSLLTCILASSFVVILYTIWGGMWSISITDFIQTIMIIAGLLIVATVLYQEVGGFQPLIDAAPPGFFRFFPENTLKGHLEYFAAWITIGLGSIPQQDVFQRVMSAKSARVSVQSTLLSSLMYLTIALLPLFIGALRTSFVPRRRAGRANDHPEYGLETHEPAASNPVFWRFGFSYSQHHQQRHHGPGRCPGRKCFQILQTRPRRPAIAENHPYRHYRYYRRLHFYGCNQGEHF